MCNYQKLLELCSTLSTGKTICLAYYKHVEIASWMGLIERRWNREDRYTLIQKLDLYLSKIILDYLAAGNRSPYTLKQLESALKGLETLLETYGIDKDFCETWTKILDKLNKTLHSSSTNVKQIEHVTFAPTIDNISTIPNIATNTIREGTLTNHMRRIKTWGAFDINHQGSVDKSFSGLTINQVD